MELFLLSLVVTGAAFAVAYVRMKRRFSIQLVSEQDQVNTLAISESQLKQKNNALQDELHAVKTEFDELNRMYSMLSGDQHDVRQKLEALTAQLEHERTQHGSVRQEFDRLKAHAGSTTAELHATIEAQTTELQRSQQRLYDESISRKHMEELLAEKERGYQHTIAELRSAIAHLEEEATHASAQARSELSARQSIEKMKHSSETDYQTKVTLLEAKLSAMTDELQRTAEKMQEEATVREATEKALQESKEKLYAHIRELEETTAQQRAALDEQQSLLTSFENKVQHLERTVFAIVHHAPVPVFVVNELGICELTNESLHNAIGFADDEVIGRHFSRFFPEGERAFYEEQWRQAGNRQEEFRGETSVITSMGDAIASEISFVEIHTGTERKFAGFIFDKTNELAARRLSAEAKQREEELQQLKSSFIAMVSNQLRTALVTVATNAELLERFLFKWNDEKRYRAFYRINESLKRMMDLLRDVETTTTVNTDRYKLAIGAVNLEALAQEAAKEAAAETEVPHRFVLSEQGDIRSVPLDASLTRTVLCQLLSNAYKYSPPDSDVTVHVERNQSHCTITVTDNGIGIPAQEQKNLFTSFFRASNAGSVPGTGLGLTIVRQSAQLAGGTVTLSSDVNRGTRVTVTLPIIAS